GSVVARELGVPCVVDVRGATRWIRTGDRVVVDGGRGRVRRIDPAGEAAEGASLGRALYPLADPGDEAFHALAADTRARESLYANVQDPGSGLALLASAGVRPHGRGEGVLAVALPNGRILFALEQGSPRTEGSLAVGGLRMG